MNNPITKTFSVKRSETFEQQFVYRTYDAIFSKHEHEKHRILQYLHDVFVYPIASKEGRQTCSGNKIKMPVQKALCNLVDYARQSEYHGQGGNQHDTVQRYLLQHDTYTIATEVPVWDDTWHGFIDVLRYFPEDNVVQIADFKPKAAKEKYAAGQVKLYMELLRLHIGDAHTIEGCYFDDTDCFIVI